MTLSKDSPVTDLNLPDKLRLRILNCLKMEGCDDIGDILAKPHRDLKLCPNFGSKSYWALVAALKEAGFEWEKGGNS